MVIEKEARDQNTILYRIMLHQKAVGVLKITLNAAVENFSAAESLSIDKVYLLNEYSGRGIGRKALQFVLLRAKEMQKKIVWLEAMQKGPALDFYLKNGFEISTASKVTLPTVITSESLMWTMIKRC